MGNTGLIWLIGALVLISVLMTGYLILNPVTFPTAKEIGLEVGKNIVIPQAPAAPAINTSGLLKKEDIAPLLADDKWETEALKIATDEWSNKGYKDIYIAIGNDIVDKEDIVYVKVTDDTVRRADAEDKDARVIQEVKVRYESTGGDEVNKYFRITTEIRDGDVEDQEIEINPTP